MFGEYLPDYIIKDCGNNGIFKIIYFKHSKNADYIKLDNEEQKENQNKLDNNICRARSTVLELALCNEWEWFVTLTLDAEKYDRYDLDVFSRDLSRWFRNQRQKYNSKLQYLLIPETHKDGAWHMHGLLNGIPYSEITDFIQGKHPDKLVNSGYKNYPAYAKKFGFISMGRIRDKAKCAFYVSKYISKDLSKRVGDLNSHLYYATQKLNRYQNASYLYGDQPELNKLLRNKGEFCETGYVFQETELFPIRFENSIDAFKPIEQRKQEESREVAETDFLFIADVITDDDLISMYELEGACK